MTVLILSPRYTEDSRILGIAARSLGWQVKRLVNRHIPADLDPTDLVLYGESFFVEYLAQELKLTLAVPEPEFLVKLPDELVKRKLKIIKRAAFTPLSTPTFVKVADIKSIAAKVYQPQEEILGLESLPLDTPLLLAEPVFWEAEYRCFIRDGKLQAMSIYMVGGEPAVYGAERWTAASATDDAAVEFVQKVLADKRVQLPMAVVIDIGLIEERGWSIVEANPAWASGIYNCQPEGVLATLKAAVRADDQTA
ncbi:MAG: ATP-grasp domain-containing protein [Anaerolineales bacterium]|nr:ATP-grasp domain-containing protein [Anaerolineales bacterium]